MATKSRPPLASYAPRIADYDVLVITAGLAGPVRCHEAGAAAEGGDWGGVRQVAADLLIRDGYFLPGSRELRLPTSGTLLVAYGPRWTVVGTYWVSEAIPDAVLPESMRVTSKPAPEFTSLIGRDASEVLAEGVEAAERDPERTEEGWLDAIGEQLVRIDTLPVASRALRVRARPASTAGSRHGRTRRSRKRTEQASTGADVRSVALDHDVVDLIQRMAKEMEATPGEVVEAAVRRMEAAAH